MTLDGSPLLRRNIPKPRAVRGDILDAVFQMHALVRGQLLGDAYAGPPFDGGPDRSPLKAAAAVRAHVVEHGVGARCTERALVRADASFE